MNTRPDGANASILHATTTPGRGFLLHFRSGSEIKTRKGDEMRIFLAEDNPYVGRIVGINRDGYEFTAYSAHVEWIREYE